VQIRGCLTQVIALTRLQTLSLSDNSTTEAVMFWECFVCKRVELIGSGAARDKCGVCASPKGKLINNKTALEMLHSGVYALDRRKKRRA
jgi:hypothetical protein